MNRNTLRMGSTGEDVKELQEILKQLGYRIQDAPGNFGQSTRSAVLAFQNDHSLVMDGVVGPITWNAISRVLLYMPQRPSRPPTVPEPLPTPTPTPPGTIILPNPAPTPRPPIIPLPTPTPEPLPTPTPTPPGTIIIPNPRVFSDDSSTAVAVDLIDPSDDVIPTQAEARPMLRQGSSGAHVTDLQNRLKELGYFTATSTGFFGTVTRAAVIAFQRDQGLAADGIVGPLTWAALDAATGTSPGETPPAQRPMLRFGSRGDFVTLLQDSLSRLGYNVGPVDGIFGNLTQAAVVAFQRNRDLAADGIVGPITWAALDNAIAELEEERETEEEIEEGVRPILREGDTGEYVRILQEKLKLTGHFAGSITASFGHETTEAVRSFQADNGLTPDGIVGPLTWAALDSATATPPEWEGETPGGPRPTLRYGDSGPFVSELQRELTALLYYTGPISGYFDSDTLVAVKSFQDVNRLTPDGVVGRSTWNALISLFPPPVLC